jgi:hypothetical protein
LIRISITRNADLSDEELSKRYKLAVISRRFILFIKLIITCLGIGYVFRSSRSSNKQWSFAYIGLILIAYKIVLDTFTWALNLLYFRFHNWRTVVNPILGVHYILSYVVNLFYCLLLISRSNNSFSISFRLARPIESTYIIQNTFDLAMDTGFLATHSAATFSNSNLYRWCMRTVTGVLFTDFRDCSILERFSTPLSFYSFRIRHHNYLVQSQTLRILQQHQVIMMPRH